MTERHLDSPHGPREDTRPRYSSPNAVLTQHIYELRCELFEAEWALKRNMADPRRLVELVEQMRKAAAVLDKTAGEL